MANRKPRTRISIDEKIEKQKEVVSKAKDKYDAAVAELEKLMAKRDEIKKKELLEVITASNMSYDEIIKMIRNADQQKSDQLDIES